MADQPGCPNACSDGCRQFERPEELDSALTGFVTAVRTLQGQPLFLLAWGAAGNGWVLSVGYWVPPSSWWWLCAEPSFWGAAGKSALYTKNGKNYRALLKIFPRLELRLSQFHIRPRSYFLMDSGIHRDDTLAFSMHTQCEVVLKYAVMLRVMPVRIMATDGGQCYVGATAQLSWGLLLKTALFRCLKHCVFYQLFQPSFSDRWRSDLLCIKYKQN